MNTERRETQGTTDGLPPTNGPAPCEPTDPTAPFQTEEEVAAFIDKFRDLWPDEAEIDEFLAWLRERRRTGY